jgi:hypothetical protein
MGKSHDELQTDLATSADHRLKILVFIETAVSGNLKSRSPLAIEQIPKHQASHMKFQYDFPFFTQGLTQNEIITELHLTTRNIM